MRSQNPMKPLTLRTTAMPGRLWPASRPQYSQLTGPLQPLQHSADEMRVRSQSVREPVVIPFWSNYDASVANNLIKDPIPMYVVEFNSNPATPSSSNDSVDEMTHFMPVDHDHCIHVEQSAEKTVEWQRFSADPEDRADDTDIDRSGDHGQSAALKVTGGVEPGETGAPWSKGDCEHAHEADDDFLATSERSLYSPCSNDVWSMSDMEESALLEEELIFTGGHSPGSWTFLSHHDKKIW